MSDWRMKKMLLTDWASFQDKYTELYLNLGGDKRMALFIQGKPQDEQSDIYITAHQHELVELLSPGGWEDADKPQGNDISLLVGHAGIQNELNVKLGLGN